MKRYRTLLLGTFAGVAAFAISSCAYEPYYSGSSYSSGYGDGYGYGGSNFSTSFFVSTSSPRWGYDPYARCYYDYNRRAYYDPYLSGYYPRGYRPRYVSGAPHPHGWSRGHDRIAPPGRIRSHNLSNYRDRGDRYQSLGRDWSENVRTSTQGRDQHRTFGREQYPDSSRDQRSRYDGRGDRSASQRGSFFGGDRNGASQRGGSSRGDSSARTYEREQPTSGNRGGSRSDRGDSQRREAMIEAMRNRGNDSSSRGNSGNRSSSRPQVTPERTAPQIDSNRDESRGGRSSGGDSRDRGDREGPSVRGLGEG
jgi:hypothetical protein